MQSIRQLQLHFTQWTQSDLLLHIQLPLTLICEGVVHLFHIHNRFCLGFFLLIIIFLRLSNLRLLLRLLLGSRLCFRSCFRSLFLLLLLLLLRYRLRNGRFSPVVLVRMSSAVISIRLPSILGNTQRIGESLELVTNRGVAATLQQCRNLTITSKKQIEPSRYCL